MHRRALAVSAAASLFFVLAGSALAQAPTAAELREKAQASLAAGNVAEACVLFDQSYKASLDTALAGPNAPAPNDVLFDLASCHEKQGQRDVAAGEFDRIAAAGGAKADEAKTRAAALRPAAAPAEQTTPPVTAQ